MPKWNRKGLNALKKILEDYKARGEKPNWSSIARDPNLQGATGIEGEIPDRRSISLAATKLERLLAPKSKKMPKFVADFEATEGEKLRARYQKRAGIKTRDKAKSTMILGWRILDKKDPAGWSLENFRDLKVHPAMRVRKTHMSLKKSQDPVMVASRLSADEKAELPQISFDRMTDLRFIMRAIGKKDWEDEPEFSTKKLKRKGEKRTQWLQGSQVIGMAKEFPTADTLVLFALAIETGARVSSLVLTKASDVMSPMAQKDGVLSMTEPKVSERVDRLVTGGMVALLTDYIETFDLTGSALLFRWNKQKYSQLIKQVGKKVAKEQKIGFAVTAHILKHTFVSLAGSKGVSLGAISEQTGTDPQTLRDFYYHKPTASQKRDLYGVETEIKNTWLAFLEELHAVVRDRFEAIKGKGVLVDGIQPLEVIREKMTGKKGRAFSLLAQYRLAHSETAPIGLRQKAVSTIRGLTPDQKQSLQEKLAEQGESFAEP